MLNICLEVQNVCQLVALRRLTTSMTWVYLETDTNIEIQLSPQLWSIPRLNWINYYKIVVSGENTENNLALHSYEEANN